MGVIRRLEDTDHDDKFDSATDYATGLSWPTSIACYNGGVIVGAPPNLYYLTDSNGHGQADKRALVY
ncbi:MAG: hypothetical protein KDB27_12995, partial [Planctomycetales bacterium]|nr:hypothetical protein [Planctomycetales bacterium]